MQTGGQSIVIHTAIKPEMAPKPAKTVKPKPKISRTEKRAGFSERLLRNTALACALLLGVMTLKNIDAPWSQAAVTGIESALTMRIDPDATLGELSFVRSIVPESTLVFLNISGSGDVEPVSGTVVHEYAEGQPWTLYSCSDGASVRSAMAGTVSAVACMNSGDWCVLVDHGDGIETMYAYMERPEVDAGDQVGRGQNIGSVRDGTLYYEYRVDGESVAPGTGAEE